MGGQAGLVRQVPAGMSICSVPQRILEIIWDWIVFQRRFWIQDGV